MLGVGSEVAGATVAGAGVVGNEVAGATVTGAVVVAAVADDASVDALTATVPADGGDDVFDDAHPIVANPNMDTVTHAIRWR